MNDLLFRLKAYLNYRLKAKSGTLAHSPFVFELAKKVLYSKLSSKNAEIQSILEYKKHLQGSSEVIEKTDLGTGASKNVNIGKLAKSSSVRKKYGLLLSKLVEFQKPNNILELGSCLGVSSRYLAVFLDDNSTLQSVEGCASTFNFRAKTIDIFQSKKESARVKFENNDFDNFLKSNVMEFDFVFIDGNHTYTATKEYFKILWNKLPEDGLIILDDIHWSDGMERAWVEICEETKNLISIDLFQFGLCFKKSQQAKEGFVLSY